MTDLKDVLIVRQTCLNRAVDLFIAIGSTPGDSLMPEESRVQFYAEFFENWVLRPEGVAEALRDLDTAVSLGVMATPAAAQGAPQPQVQPPVTAQQPAPNGPTPAREDFNFNVCPVHGKAIPSKFKKPDVQLNVFCSEKDWEKIVYVNDDGLVAKYKFNGSTLMKESEYVDALLAAGLVTP